MAPDAYLDVNHHLHILDSRVVDDHMFVKFHFNSVLS